IRKPSVGPRWLIASQRIVAEPNCHSLGGVSRNETSQGSSRPSTGDSGAEMYRATRFSSDASGEAGPQIVMSASERKQGGKNIRPWMWSRCRWGGRRLRWGEEGFDARRDREVESERADAGPRVEDHVLATCERELDARRVAAVTVHLGPRGGHGTPRAPHLDPHAWSSRLPSPCGQKKIMAPEDPSSEATIGNALDWISRLSPLADLIVNTACAGRPSRTARVVGSSSSSTGFPWESNGPYVEVHSSGLILPTSSNERPSSAPAASL